MKTFEVTFDWCAATELLASASLVIGSNRETGLTTIKHALIKAISERLQTWSASYQKLHEFRHRLPETLLCLHIAH